MALTSASGSPPAAAGSSAYDWRRVELHPVFVRRLLEDEYAVVRCDGGGVVRTRSLGVEALRLLQQTGSVPAVRAVLRSWYDTEVDLGPLLQSLLRAGIVRRAGHGVVNTDRIRVGRVVRCFWRCRVDLPIRVPHWVFRTLPPRFALPWIRRLGRKRIRRAPHLRTLGSIAQRLPYPPPGPAPKEVAERHVSALAENDALARMICTARTAPLTRWLHRHVSIEGLHHLEPARSNGRGVIIALLHHGPFPLVAAKLLSCGVPIHSFHFGVEFAGRSFDDVCDDHRRHGGWERARFYYTPAPSNLAHYIRAVASGEVGVVMPDYYRAHPSGAEHGIHAYRGIGKRNSRETSVTVPFGERRVRLHTFTGWLVRMSGAAVVPCEATAGPDGSYRIRLGEPMTDFPAGPAESRDAAITRQVFAALAPWLVRRPEHWSFLLNYAEAGPGGTSGAGVPA